MNKNDYIMLDAKGKSIKMYSKLITGIEPNKQYTMKITFESPEQLQKAEIDIQELLDRKFKGAYFSVSAGEI